MHKNYRMHRTPHCGTCMKRPVHNFPDSQHMQGQPGNTSQGCDSAMNLCIDRGGLKSEYKYMAMERAAVPREIHNSAIGALCQPRVPCQGKEESYIHDLVSGHPTKARWTTCPKQVEEQASNGAKMYCCNSPSAINQADSEHALD